MAGADVEGWSVKERDVGASRETINLASWSWELAKITIYRFQVVGLASVEQSRAPWLQAAQCVLYCIGRVTSSTAGASGDGNCPAALAHALKGKRETPEHK